ncbi:MAG: helix-turn-helix transcriptional regulator [Oscillospiraceae bacterium]|nr:helix-turn-helix transcriptional regulator [Oscillospiraceae bacterium]
MTHYTKRLRDTREDSDKTQAEIAVALKMHVQQYQLYESGKRKMSVDVLIELSAYYNVSTDYLLGLSDKKERA